MHQEMITPSFLPNLEDMKHKCGSVAYLSLPLHFLFYFLPMKGNTHLPATTLHFSPYFNIDAGIWVRAIIIFYKTSYCSSVFPS